MRASFTVGCMAAPTLGGGQRVTIARCEHCPTQRNVSFGRGIGRSTGTLGLWIGVSIGRNLRGARMNIEGLRICTACRIHHYENCGTCFGFGMYPGRDGSLVPISAGAAHSGEFPGNWATCPECDSGPEGLRKKNVTGLDESLPGRGIYRGSDDSDSDAWNSTWSMRHFTWSMRHLRTGCESF